MFSDITALVVAIGAVLVFWTISSTSTSPFTRSFPRLVNKRICLLIAHPDDEAMFFAPAVLALTQPELGNHLKILCFSTGDADGLGETRKKELQKSALQLGVRDESDVFVVDDPSRFPDGMKESWKEEEITSLLASAFAPDLAASLKGKKPNANKAPTATIDILLTFDQHGVSNHPNHRSLYHGAVHFLRTLMKDKAGFASPLTLYTLTSVPIWRKYAGVLDAPLSMLQGACSSVWTGLTRKKKKADDGPARLLFVSSVGEWMTAHSAMVKGHQSQMVWFRWGWITIGRYMVVNDLKRVTV
ncbi:hypothetical protein PENDEC_c009G01931 [Penicillium decumbens]|uniref:N-acetylglucosaminylphosphatidylinositol deacetylase n=1 Tax=Penicillium decumbens TaxID=69771 RepID=A0A1V6PDR1_PENDC|nr:hypothetical protein PENDEC_c009G01931 [Penicillium decumbens]